MPLVVSGCREPVAPAVTHAIVVFRDDVPAYQKLASQKYAEHQLDGSYDVHTYLEATAVDDGKVRWLKAMQDAAARFTTVDAFFFSNGGRYDLWAEGLDAVTRSRVRLVYNTGASNAGQGTRWVALGAKAYVGHRGGNVAPVFLAAFLPRWLKGKKLSDAVAEANRETHDDLDGLVAQGIEQVLDVAGGPHLDRARLWAGTEAVITGDSTLTMK